MSRVSKKDTGIRFYPRKIYFHNLKSFPLQKYFTLGD